MISVMKVNLGCFIWSRLLQALSGCYQWFSYHGVPSFPLKWLLSALPAGEGKEEQTHNVGQEEGR